MLGSEIENPNGVRETFLNVVRPSLTFPATRLEWWCTDDVKKLGMVDSDVKTKQFLGALFGRRRSESPGKTKRSTSIAREGLE